MSLGSALLLAWGIAAGIPPIGAILVGLTLVDPRWGAVATVGCIAISIRKNRVDSIVGSRRFFERVSAELDAGMSLRAALIEGVATMPENVGAPLRRRLEAGVDVVEVGEALAAALPLPGSSLAAAVGVASTGGGSTSGVFTGLGLDVSEEAELARERRVLTTQARLTSVIVGGAPFFFLLYQTITGSLAGRFRTAHGALLTLIGGVLVLIGVVWVLVQMRGTRDR